jgi:hypothetical protein
MTGDRDWRSLLKRYMAFMLLREGTTHTIKLDDGPRAMEPPALRRSATSADGRVALPEKVQSRFGGSDHASATSFFHLGDHAVAGGVRHFNR